MAHTALHCIFLKTITFVTHFSENKRSLLLQSISLHAKLLHPLLLPPEEAPSVCTAVASELLGYRLPSSGPAFLKLHVNIFMEVVQLLELLSNSEP